MIRINDLRKVYRTEEVETIALDNMSLHVKEHEFAKLTGYRVYTEKIFPFLARKLRLQPEWDYRDLYGAVLEVLAKKMQMEVYEVYTPDDIVGKIHELFSDRLTIG